MGATCSLAGDASTTHLVANSRGTDKFLWAQKNGKHVVTPSWLSASSKCISVPSLVSASVPLQTNPSEQACIPGRSGAIRSEACYLRHLKSLAWHASWCQGSHYACTAQMNSHVHHTSRNPRGWEYWGIVERDLMDLFCMHLVVASSTCHAWQHAHVL